MGLESPASTHYESPDDLDALYEEGGILIVDDTIEEKPYTDESELICWHYDHSQGRTVKGINLLLACFTGWKMQGPGEIHG